ncbi:chromate transporter [Enterococcus timonensis]|uniref:chromate transporter n=1 Tax=Enterococcus timonensis TaxID=1852364 RepID=UPI0008DA6676|nr:chromate transporter [Enterococcus timonensis]
MIYWKLFVSFLKIGAFSFGGGYAALPLIQAEVVDGHHWLTMASFTDLITISQMTPGPIAINTATFVGTTTGGILGAVVATIGAILPSCIIVTVLAWLYLKFRNMSVLQKVLQTLRPAVVAMIATAGVSIILSAFFAEKVVALKNLNLPMVVIFILCVVLLTKFKANPIFVMVLSGVLNVAVYLMTTFVF